MDKTQKCVLNMSPDEGEISNSETKHDRVTICFTAIPYQLLSKVQENRQAGNHIIHNHM
jgi:hypothetical protein